MGRKKALQSLVDSMKKEGAGYENKVAFIVHGDCIEDANKVADKRLRRIRGILCFGRR